MSTPKFSEVLRFLSKPLSDMVNLSVGGFYHFTFLRIYCVDGFNISAQGASGSYATSKIIEKGIETSTRGVGEYYTAMELGFPNQVDSLIEEYGETSGGTNDVFPYTPIDVIDDLIEKHGGIDWEVTTNNVGSVAADMTITVIFDG